MTNLTPDQEETLKEVFIVVVAVLFIVLASVAASIGVVYILESFGYHELTRGCECCCKKGCGI